MSGANQTPNPLCGRLAPSPTGALHLGNARTFLITWLSIRSRNGKLIYRLEDLDHPKVKAGAAEEAMQDLKWLGLDWDEGPDMDGPRGPYIQSARVPVYRDALDRLIASGLVYPCICSRKDVEAAQGAPQDGEDGLYYPGTCRDRFKDYQQAQAVLSPDRLPAWRFAAGRESTSFADGFHGAQTSVVKEDVGDFAIARHPDGAGYMLGVVVDDAAMGVTEILRGDDLLATTHRQILLQRALGLPAPEYIHVPLVVGPDGRRLAKRHGDTRIAEFRDQGISPSRIVGLLASWCGWANPGEELMPSDLIERFSLDAIPRHPIVLPENLA